MKILSLFDGMSVAQQALKNCGIKVDAYCASEIDSYSIATTQSNFPDTIQAGSVVDLKGSDFKDIDLIVGGFPCTNLSIAKKNREGLAGSQSGLFYEMVRIHKEVKPRWFLYENVASMARDQKEIITQTIGELMQCPCGCGQWGCLDRCMENVVMSKMSSCLAQEK